MLAKNSSPSTTSPAEQPFWVDEPYPHFAHEVSKPGTTQQHFDLIRIFTYLFPFVFLILVAGTFARFTPLAWIFIALFGLFPFIGIYQQQRRKSSLASAMAVQQQARERTGASTIGSAVHVAGHPLLEREQPVVIALRDDHLSFFSYQSPSPIDTLPVKSLQAIHTVVYDDERVPHVEVIDSTAQALQLVFTWRGHTCTCLFRHMHKVRPIDWYHAIQQARLGALSQVGAA